MSVPDCQALSFMGYKLGGLKIRSFYKTLSLSNRCSSEETTLFQCWRKNCAGLSYTETVLFSSVAVSEGIFKSDFDCA